ncbi:hypothetical protein, partial [Gluconacetobacter azotocaptans]
RVADLAQAAAARPAVLLAEGDAPDLDAVLAALGEGDGPVVPVHVLTATGPLPEWLLEERLVSTNTTAAGGNASLMAIG